MPSNRTDKERNRRLDIIRDMKKEAKSLLHTLYKAKTVNWEQVHTYRNIGCPVKTQALLAIRTKISSQAKDALEIFVYNLEKGTYTSTYRVSKILFKCKF